MNILSKIIIALITIAVFIFLFFVTFITNSFTSTEKPFYENTKIGLYKLIKDSNNIYSISNRPYSNNNEIFVEKINTSDKIFFSSGSIKTEHKGLNIIISTTPGIYLFDLKEINSKYTIKGKGFEIKNKGPGIFFVNTLNSRKNLIFSINTILDLNLKHYNTNEDITNIDLYPHTYLIFNPLKNIFVRNSDLLKISQTFTIGYYSKQIIINNKVSESFIDLISIKNENSKEIISSSILYLKQEYLESIKNINTFISSTFGTIPGETFINKYRLLFVNPNKKSLYYKNIIIRNLHELLSKNELNYEIINLIVKNIKLIEDIDKIGADEIRNLITYYYGEVIKSNKNVIIKINISELLNEINNYNLTYEYPSLIYLEKIFFKYDFLGNNNFYHEISQFREQFFNDLMIDITGENKNSIYDIERVDYILFFIENLLLTSNFSSGDIDTKDLKIMFNDYVEIANSFYPYSDEKTKRTGIFTNSKILNKFVNILEEKYFEKERNKNGLLTLKNDVIIIEDDILLEKKINELFIFYKNNKNILKENINNKDKFIIKLYSSLEQKYREFFFALNDYNDYLTKYDKEKVQLLSTNTINENNGIITLSIENAKEYLENFNGINLKNTTIKLMDYNYCQDPLEEKEKLPLEVAYCYKIEKININSGHISFLLHPFNKNKIDEIKINGEEKKGSYKLDEIKIILDEKIKTETKDKDKYDFKNFLISTFGERIINNNQEIIVVKEEQLEEDSVIKIFKRNKLLGKTGDFINLKGFLDINYKDLIVQRIADGYSININNAIFNINLGKNKTYYGKFISEYNFSPSHSFINPKIKLIDKKNKKDLLLGNYIYIIGEYKVNNIQEEIKDLFLQYSTINHIVSTSSQILRTTDIKIKYIKKSNIIAFEISYKGGIIYLELNKGEITIAKYNNIDILENKIPYTNLPIIFNKIIN